MKKRFRKNTVLRRSISLSACLSVLLLVSCSPSMNSTSSSSLDQDSNIQVTDLQTSSAPDAVLSESGSSLAALQQDLAGASSIFSQENDLIDIKHLKNADGEKLVIKNPEGPIEFEVSKTEEPNRLIVDLKNFAAANDRNVEPSSDFIKSVALSREGQGSKILIDLDKDKDIASEVTSDNGQLIINLQKEADLAQNKAKDSSPLLAEQSAEQNKKLADAGNVKPDTDKLIASAGAAATVPSLVGLGIEPSTSAGNMLVADVSESARYTLTKTAPSEYTLRLRNTQLAKAASGVVISPPGEGSIRTVRPVVEGEDVVLRIFAKPESTLTANKEGNKIIVAGLSPRDSLDTIRAQMNPDAGKPAESSPDASKPKSEVTVKDVSKSASKGKSDEASYLSDSSYLSGPKYTGRLISLDLQDTDIDNALRIIAEVSNLNIIASEDVTGKVTLRLIDVPWDQALDVILKTNGLDKVQEGNVVRIAPVEKLRNEREQLKQARQAEEELEPLQVKYIRVSYAKAAELKPLIENVLTERGAVTYDERTNQVIIKDIANGIKNVSQLVSKLDLRTPQVLLETQIVEATRTLLRDLGSETGFRYIQSPANGNATGRNFPNSIDLGGTLTNPAAATTNSISLLFGSADGSKSLTERITALETEGRIRVVSRPAVATTNNKQAVIKSVEKIRVRLPNSGVSVATGQGATAAGNGNVATEIIEIGIILEVTPQASPDYYVLLDINAKSSTLGTNSVEGIPSEIERSATSSVLVSSGQTFALGGIYKITDNDNVGGLPFFKDIPFFGTFFRRSNIDKRDEELLFFLTPRIVEGSFDDATMKSST
jgi:type IV pilus secretin PilQ/predicted competence protein